ncbi:MAG: cofactor-independent phosphoglycerate mutase [Candidatus Hydrogenedentota bacterium]
MKFLILVGDGMADFPLDELNGKTPIEAANTPAMDELASLGMCALFCPIPEGLPPGSDIGNLSLFGYDPRSVFTGRAPMEAANQGIELAQDQVAFRCNLVCIDDGRMKSFTAGHITTEEADAIIKDLNYLFDGSGMDLHTGVSYRHLGIVKTPRATVEQLVSVATTPPHNITDQEVDPYLPDGEGNEVLLEWMERAKGVLNDHPINRKRIADGKLPATSIWLWGQGRAPKIEPYPQKFALYGAVVSAVDLVNGIGKLAGLEVLKVPGLTGYLDTNYEGKVEASLKALERLDFAYLHVEAPDETSHEGRTDLKIQAIEDFDRRVVRPCLDWAKARGDVRVLVCPDHITAISTKTHAGGPVPFALFGPGVEQDRNTTYSETAGAQTGLLFPYGHELIDTMLRARVVSSSLVVS